MIGLIDCNNFYVSCERIFRPDLKDKPVVVLSNNDGCAISRSQEAKALGIKMGDPYFKFRDMGKEKGLHIFSSNFSLYGDISHRVMDTIKEYCPRTEVYSVDESFIDASNIEDLDSFGRDLRQILLKWVGIPTCIGFGPTKTLAKIANQMAKKHPSFQGIYVLHNPDPILKSLPVSEIWGIGRRLGLRLNTVGIETALDLKKADPQWIRSLTSSLVERTIYELNGISYFPLETTPSLKKSIMVSRSFKEAITESSSLSGIVTSFALRASEKLRNQSGKCKKVTVYIRTNPFSKSDFYGNCAEFTFPQAVSDTANILKGVKQCLKQIFKSGYGYKKAGVCLSNIVPEQGHQKGLFDQDFSKQEKLSQLMDGLNHRFGSGTLSVASSSPLLTVGNRRFQSPKYTTHWSEVMWV